MSQFNSHVFEDFLKKLAKAMDLPVEAKQHENIEQVILEEIATADPKVYAAVSDFLKYKEMLDYFRFDKELMLKMRPVWDAETDRLKKNVFASLDVLDELISKYSIDSLVLREENE